MALLAWFELVLDRPSKSGLNAAVGLMPCMLAGAACKPTSCEARGGCEALLGAYTETLT